MNPLVLTSTPTNLPAPTTSGGAPVFVRVIEFFAVSIPNPHIGKHSRATGSRRYPENGGTLEKAAQMANHASTRTTRLYSFLLQVVARLCLARAIAMERKPRLTPDQKRGR